MLVTHQCYKARSYITAFEILHNNTVAFSTQYHGAKLFSYIECSIIKNLSIELLGYKTTAVTFSTSSDLLAFANNNIIYIVDTLTKTLIQTIRTYEGEIEQLAFAPKSKYLIAGTKHGRVMQYRYDGRSGLSRLCSFGHSLKKTKLHIKNNYVSAFAFHKNLLACSGYGGVITIIQLYSHANRYDIKASKFRINTLCFLDETRLASGSIDGTIRIHPLQKYQAPKTINTPFTDINSIIVMSNPQYIMVSAASKNLVIIDTHSAKIVSTSYLTFQHEVQKITLTKENNLLVVLVSRELYKIQLPTVEEIKSCIFHSDINKAYELLEANPTLQGTREHKRVEVLYEKLYTQAIDALIHSDTKEARRIMQKFSNIKSKQDDINSIFKAFEHYPRFQYLYNEKKYALIYAMAEKYPALKHTHQYKKIEEKYKKDFNFAQKQVLIGRVDIAKEVLRLYATITSKKAVLNLLLNQNSDFIAFLNAISTKDPIKMNELVQKNAIFSQIPTFTKVTNSTQQTLEEIRHLLIQGDTQNAISLIKSLKHLQNIKEQLEDFYRDAQLISKLQKSYEKNDFKLCYEILDSSENLSSMELSLLLEKQWSVLMNICEEDALKGDIKSIKKRLGDLIGVRSRLNKIGDLLRLSFYTKIKALLAKRNFQSAENIIYSYIDIFGLDSEISMIMKTYEKYAPNKLAITANKDKRVPRDNWLHSSVIMG